MHVPQLHMMYCISTCCNTSQSRYCSACPITLGSSDIVLIIEKMLKWSVKYGFTCREPPAPISPAEEEVYAITLFHNPFALCRFLCSLHCWIPFDLCAETAHYPVQSQCGFWSCSLRRLWTGMHWEKMFSLELSFETGSRGLPKMLGRGNVVWLVAHRKLLVDLLNTMRRNAILQVEKCNVWQ